MTVNPADITLVFVVILKMIIFDVGRGHCGFVKFECCEIVGIVIFGGGDSGVVLGVLCDESLWRTLRFGSLAFTLPLRSSQEWSFPFRLLIRVINGITATMDASIGKGSDA